MNRTVFKTLAQFKALNAKSGRHFFARDAMEFFNSRIESELIRGRYFITSEQYSASSPRLFSVRRCNKDGSVTTMQGFKKFQTKAEACEWIKRRVNQNGTTEY